MSSIDAADGGVVAAYYACDTSLAELVIREEAAPAAITEDVQDSVPAEVAPSVTVPPPPVDADIKLSEAETPGPWFDTSPYDAKLPVLEVGLMLRAFEEILWTNGSDLNSIEAMTLMHMIHRMRTTLTALELAIIQPRIVQQRCMPSMRLVTGVRDCFGKLLDLRGRLKKSPGGAASAEIIDETGREFAKLLAQQKQQQASAVGINLDDEKAKAAPNKVMSNQQSAAAVDVAQLDTKPQMSSVSQATARRKRRTRKQLINK